MAHLFLRELLNAQQVVKIGLEYDDLHNKFNLLTLAGVIAIKQSDSLMARQFLTEALKEIDEILLHNTNHSKAQYTKGLALAGLIICESEDYLESAVKAFKLALPANKATGVIKRHQKLLKILKDSNNIIDQIYSIIT